MLLQLWVIHAAMAAFFFERTPLRFIVPLLRFIFIGIDPGRNKNHICR